MSRTRAQARAARRATIRSQPLGFRNLVGIETCYYNRRAALNIPPVPAAIRDRYTKIHDSIEFLADKCAAGDADWAEYDRVHNDLNHVAYRDELRTRTGLDYYTAVARINAIVRRNNTKEAALIRAERRHARIHRLRAAYRSRR